VSCHGLQLVEGEEADVGELGGERAAIGVLRPQVPERRARRDRRVHGVVAIDDDLEDAVTRHAFARGPSPVEGHGTSLLVSGGR